MARIRLLTAGVLLSVILAGCSAGPSTSGSGPKPLPATVVATATQQLARADGIATLRLKGYVTVESTETSKLSAPDAVAKVRWDSVENTTTTLTVSKVRLTGPGVRNRLVWVIGVSPVVWFSHGIVTGKQSTPEAMQGPSRGAFVIDANTGEEGPDVIGPVR